MLILKNKINLEGINFGGSQNDLFLVATNFGGFFINPPNPPKLVPKKISSLKVARIEGSVAILEK